MEPLAERLLEKRPTGPTIARKAVGAQAGAILGYVSRRVLGQFDVFLPPDDEGLIYFVGPNLDRGGAHVRLVPSDFRLWVAIHEVTHRVQFSAAPWLKGVSSPVWWTSTSSSISLDSRELDGAAQARGRGGARRGGRAMGGVFLLLNAEQRDDLRPDAGR